MTIQAQFSTKKWEISPNKVMPITNISYSSGVKTETAKTSGGKDKVVSKGYKADTLSVSYNVQKNAGCNPEVEYSDMKVLVGKTAPFLLNGKRFGANMYRLNSVRPSNIILTNKGEILSMTITAGFEEPIVAKSDAKTIGKTAKSIEKFKSEKGIKK